jgi:hypothetical protein
LLGGVGTRTRIFRENASTDEKMPYENFKKLIEYYLKQVAKEQKDAFIKEIYY